MWAFVTSQGIVETAMCVFVAIPFLKQKVSAGLYAGDRAHPKNLKNLVEVQLPGRDRLFVVLRVKQSRDRIPFAPLDQLPLNICHSPAIGRTLVDGSKCMSLVRLTMSIRSSHHTQTD